LNDSRPLWRRAAGPAALFLFAFLICLYYGRRGWMPLDHSIVFDGGWRLLNGQAPFRDYHAPNGFVLHAMQAAFFAAFGVNWLAYCLHAAVVNGLFALLVQRLLAVLGLWRPASFVYAALSALVLYPPVGVPYMDPHAFFFSLLAVALALSGRAREQVGAPTWAWLLLPTVLTLAGLSKQIPSAFAIPIVLVIVLWDRRGPALRRLLWMSAGTLVLAVVLGLTTALLDVDLDRMDTYFRELPSEEGARRYAYVPGVGPILDRMHHIGAVLGLHSITIVHAGAAAGVLSLGLLPFVRSRRERVLAPLRMTLLAEALLVMGLVFIALTSNQPEIGVPYVFFCAGLIHLTLERARDGLLRMRANWLAAGARVLGAVVLGLALRDGYHFAKHFDATRSFNDIAWSTEAAALASSRVHPDLAFMGWQVPANVDHGPAHLRDLVEFLREREGNVLLISDASIVYGLAGKPSTAPSLWWHPGLVIPRPDDPRLVDYEQLLLDQVERYQVRFLVLEGDHTWIGVSLDLFPRLRTLAEQHRIGTAEFGPFEVIDLGRRQRQ
jgi:hypothetical protein